MHLQGLVAAGLMTCLAGTLVWLAPPTANRNAPIYRGETRTIKLSLPAPKWVTVTAGQFEIDLTLSVIYPDGRTIEGADRGPYGRETLLFLTDTPGDYHVRIQAAPNGSIRGRYDFQLQEVRPPRPADSQALQAQQQFVQAAHLENAVTAESQEQAHALYHSAAARFQTAALPMLEAQAKSNEGRILDRAGKRESAYHLYMDSLRLRERINDPEGRLESLLLITRLSGHLRQKFNFVPDDFGFLDAWQRLGDRRAIAHAMSIVSSAFRRKSDFPQAASWAERSVQFARQLEDPSLEARCLESLVKAQLELRQYDAALRNARLILAAKRQLNDLRGETAALGLIAFALLSSGRQEEAIPYIQQELALQLTQEDPTGAAESHYSLAAIYLRLGNLRLAAAHDEAAIALTLRSAGDFLSPKWRTGFLSSYAFVEHYSRVLSESGRFSEAMMVADRCRWRAFGGTVDFSLQDLLSQLDEGTVLLESWFEPDRITLWTANPSGVRHHVALDSGRIAALATRVWGCYATRKACPDESRELSRQLLGPVWPQLRGKRIVIAADGILSYFPFAALPDPSRDDDRPLLLDHEIVQVPSASALVAQRRHPRPRVDSSTRIAILSDPVFDRRDPRLDHPNAAPSRLEPELVRALEANGLPLERGAIPRLSFAAAETSAILAAIPPSLPRQLLTGFDARRDLLSQPLPVGSILHLATHGFVNEDDSDLSGLVFSLVNSEGQPVDGYFRLRDLYALDLPARLVVLSACQTACGRQYVGQPAFSLAAAFLRAGAQSVVASGWKVNDESTAEFMRLFYRQLLSSPDMRVPQALRAAQIELRNNPRWTHPYFWAAFSAYGEWR